MYRNSKKGFTVVELVIVIAIIAILAAVLIPTFAALIQKANVSKDTQLVKNLNTALAIDGKNHPTMQSALDAASEAGFDIQKINRNAQMDNEIIWDSVNDVFCYLVNKSTVDKNNIQYIPDQQVKTPVENVPLYKYWRITDDATLAQNGQCSVYYIGTETTITTKVGFDAGTKKDITSVEYVGVGREQDVVIRTNGGSLTVDAATDDVKHYGWCANLKVTAVRDNHCYHEFGFIGTFESFGTGKFVAESGSGFHQTRVEIDERLNGKNFDLDNGEKYGVHYYVEGKCVTCNIDECQHNWGEGVIDAEATCGADGSKTFTCSKCGETKTDVIPATGAHTWGAWTTNETTHSHNCSICGATDSDEHDTAGEGGKCSACGYSADPCAEGHTVETWTVIKEQTCTETGLKYGTCTKCGDVRVEEIPMHFLTENYYQKPGAYSHMRWCTECGEYFNRGDCVKDPCSVCNNTKYTEKHLYQLNYKNETQHNVICPFCGDFKISAHDTDGEGGSCSVCGYKTHEHTASVWTVTKDPTCTETGTKKGPCTVDGCVVTVTETIPATGHTITSYTGFDMYNHMGECDTCHQAATQSHQYELVGSGPDESGVYHYKCACGVLMEVSGTNNPTHEHTSITIHYEEWGKTTKTIDGKTYSVWICSCGGTSSCGATITYYVPVK